jgi:hypothetical protein
LCTDALGADGEFLRVGGSAGLLANLGQTVKRFCREGMVRPEDLLADCQRTAVEVFGAWTSSA